MYFSIAALFFGAAIATPFKIPGRGAPCKGNGLYSVPKCCSVDIVNAADLNCVSPSSAKDVTDFHTSCAVSGADAKCCTVPAAGQAVLCIGP